TDDAQIIPNRLFYIIFFGKNAPKYQLQYQQSESVHTNNLRAVRKAYRLGRSIAIRMNVSGRRASPTATRT
ncbi:hypothetical protein, partial [Xanthomonas oryzae]|uniref:hypothetical protein n=1 Tax=Xanthomonas oryzae TaxID=347 RepID=UPI001ED99CDD